MGSQPTKQPPGSTGRRPSSAVNAKAEKAEEDDVMDDENKNIQISNENDESESNDDDESSDDISLSEKEERTKATIFEEIENCVRVISNVNSHVTERKSCSREFWRAGAVLSKLHDNLSNFSDSPTKNLKLQKLEGKKVAEIGGIEAICDAIVHILQLNKDFQYLIDGDDTETEEDVEFHAWDAVRILLVYLVNYTDVNSKFSKHIVCHTKYVSHTSGFIQQIGSKYLSDDSFGGDSNQQIVNNVMTIFHNVAQTGKHASELRSVNLVEIFLPLLKTDNDEIRLLSLSVLAELVDEKEARSLEANQNSIKYLIDILNEAVESDDGRTSDGWSSRELAHIVRRIGRNDINKKTLVNLGCLPPLIKLAKSNDKEEKREAVSALWTLSFDEENQTKMIEGDDNLVELLLDLSKDVDTKVKKACNGALWNLREKMTKSSKYSNIGIKLFNREEKKSEEDIAGKRSGHVMISYQWGHQKHLVRIKENLRRNNIKVWMDVDDMQGSTLAAMAKAVEDATIVLVCYSQKYKDSDNCRAEAEYAFQLKKTIIPLKMELGYKPDGWLGFIIGTKLFFDFSGKYPFEAKVEGLVKEIHSKMNRVVPTKVNVTMASQFTVGDQKSPTVTDVPDAASGVRRVQVKADDSVKKWKERQVTDWLNRNGLSRERFSKLEGADIAFLKVLRLESPDFFYKTLQDMLQITDLQTLRKFTFALDDAN